MQIRIEGYWRTSYAPHLPTPVTGVEWPERAHFLTLLDDAELAAHAHHTKGMSKCRVCGEINGSIEYELGGWRWPEGLRHYLYDHGVRPTHDFEAFVLGRSR
jgi:hypothetical protein